MQQIKYAKNVGTDFIFPIAWLIMHFPHSRSPCVCDCACVRQWFLLGFCVVAHSVKISIGSQSATHHSPRQRIWQFYVMAAATTTTTPAVGIECCEQLQSNIRPEFGNVISDGKDAIGFKEVSRVCCHTGWSPIRPATLKSICYYVLRIGHTIFTTTVGYVDIACSHTHTHTYSSTRIRVSAT